MFLPVKHSGHQYGHPKNSSKPNVFPANRYELDLQAPTCDLRVRVQVPRDIFSRPLQCPRPDETAAARDLVPLCVRRARLCRRDMRH